MPSIPGGTPFPCDPEVDRLHVTYGTPSHIIEHERVVAACITVLGLALAREGIAVNVPLARSAGLVHDIGKWFQLPEGNLDLIKGLLHEDDPRHHTMYGLRILEHEGYPVVGHLVSLHMGGQYARDPAAFETIEAVLVMLGDMRVLEASVVSLRARVAYVQERYGISFGDGLERLLDIEARVFSAAGLEPAGLAGIVQEHFLKEKECLP